MPSAKLPGHVDGAPLALPATAGHPGHPSKTKQPLEEIHRGRSIIPIEGSQVDTLTALFLFVLQEPSPGMELR